MIETESKQILKARKEVQNFLSKRPSFFDVALYYKCTLEWHNDKPNEFNTECLRLLHHYFKERGIEIENYYANIL